MIKWGIIGAGDVAEVKSGPAFNKAGESALHAVMRRNAEKAKDFAKRHNVPKYYSDSEDLLRDQEINAVYIATPPVYHKALTIKALEAGKHVYVEKPMAMHAGECEEMIEASERTGKKLVVAHYRRALPAFQKVKSLLEEGAIGIPKFANIKIWQPAASEMIAQSETNWRLDPNISGGGLFHDLAPHQIDLMLVYFGKPVEYHGFSENQALLTSADDIVFGNVLFENKVMVHGNWCFSVSEDLAEENFEIIGSKGKISFPFYGTEVNLLTDGIRETMPFQNPENIQLPMIEATNRYFLDQGPNPCSGAMGKQVMEIMDVFTKKNI